MEGAVGRAGDAVPPSEVNPTVTASGGGVFGVFEGGALLVIPSHVVPGDAPARCESEANVGAPDSARADGSIDSTAGEVFGGRSAS